MSKEEVEAALQVRDTGEGEEEEDSEADFEGTGSEDGAGSDLEEDEEPDQVDGEQSGDEDILEEDNQQTHTSHGSVVWVLWGGRRYPAKVVSLAEVPETLKGKIRKDDGKSVVVKFYGDDDYSRVAVEKVMKLGQTDLDVKWSRLPGVLRKYELALEDFIQT